MQSKGTEQAPDHYLGHTLQRYSLELTLLRDDFGLSGHRFLLPATENLPYILPPQGQFLVATPVNPDVSVLDPLTYALSPPLSALGSSLRRNDNRPRKRAAEPRQVELLLDEGGEGPAGPEIAVVGIAAARSDVEILASDGVHQGEIRFVGDAHDDGAAADAGQFFQCGVGIVQVLQHFEAADDIELAILEGEVIDAGGDEGGTRILRFRQLDRWLVEVETGDWQSGELAGHDFIDESLAASRIQERGRRELAEFRHQHMVKTVDQLALQRIAAAVLLVIARLFGGIVRRGDVRNGGGHRFSSNGAATVAPAFASAR